MFDALADRLEEAWKKMRGQDKISESNVKDALREVRRALLEADVNLQVIKDFIAEVEQKALGAEVIAGVRPDQQFIEIVYEELLAVMGEANVPLAQAPTKPTVVLMAGLQPLSCDRHLSSGGDRPAQVSRQANQRPRV
jgi:signal recognition particle subunit SRP54